MTAKPILVATANLARAHRMEPERVPERERELAAVKIQLYIEREVQVAAAHPRAARPSRRPAA